MDLVDVDDVRLQAAQRVLDLLDDAALAGVAVGFVVLPGQTDFGRDDGPLAAAILGESPADDLLGAAEPVDRRRIDEVDTAVERRVDCLNRFILVCPTPHPTADRPGSERDARHFERGGEIFHLGIVRLICTLMAWILSFAFWLLLPQLALRGRFACSPASSAATNPSAVQSRSP